jgi:hypothetical protein
LIANEDVTGILGWLFLASGATGLATTYWARQAPGFLWSLVSALLAIFVGVVLIENNPGGPEADMPPARFAGHLHGASFAEPAIAPCARPRYIRSAQQNAVGATFQLKTGYKLAAPPGLEMSFPCQRAADSIEQLTQSR